MASSTHTANIMLAKCEQQVMTNCPTVHRSMASLPHRFDSLHVCIQLQMNTQPLSMPRLIWNASRKWEASVHHRRTDHNELIAVTILRSYVDVVKYVVFHVKLNRKHYREYVVRRNVFTGHLTVLQDHERWIDIALVFDFTLSLDAVEKERKNSKITACSSTTSHFYVTYTSLMDFKYCITDGESWPSVEIPLNWSIRNMRLVSNHCDVSLPWNHSITRHEKTTALFLCFTSQQ